MIAVLAATLFAPAVLDYTTVAKPLPVVLEELTALTGSQMRAAKDTAGDKLVVRVDDVEIEALRERIAEAVDGKWTDKGDHLLLERDPSVVARRRDAELGVLAGALRKDILGDRYEKPIYSEREWNQLARDIESPDIIGWVLFETLLKLGSVEIASIPLDTRITYSSKPNRMQRGLSGVEPLLQEALTLHNKFASIVQSTGIDEEPEVDSWAYRQRRQSIKEWEGPLELILTVENSEDSITASATIVGANGRELDSDFENFYPWVAREKPKLPEGTAASATAVLSQDALSINTLEHAAGLSAITEIPFEATFVERLKRPTRNDPLSFSYSEYITEIGRAFDWDVVASVRDEMWVPPPEKEGPITVALLLNLIADNQFTRWSREGSWLTLGPTAMYNLRQVDRSALEALIRTSSKTTPGLLAAAKFAASSPDQPPLAGYDAYICSLTNGYLSDYDDWVWLRFIDALPRRVKEVALQGGSVLVSDIGPAARSQLEHIICYNSQTDVYTTYEEIYRGDDPNCEPTEAIPNGLPNSVVINFTVTRGFCALKAPKVKGAFAGIAEDMWLVALSATDRFANIDEAHLDPFWIGEGSEIEIDIKLSEDVSVAAGLSDRWVKKSGRTYTLNTAPEPFIKAFRKAVDDWLTDREGGE